MGLKELALHDISELDAEMLLVLSACENLERLCIQCIGGSGGEDDPRVSSTITLPRLQVMDLKFRWGESAANLIRRLVTPQLLRGSLDVGYSALQTHRAAYCRFMSQGKTSLRYPSSADIRIEPLHIALLANRRIVYETEIRRIAFNLPSWENHVQTIHDLVREFQGLFREPALTVTVTDPSDCTWPLLRSLGDQNVRTIDAYLDGEKADDLLTALGAPSDPTNVLATNDATDQAFESLKSIAIHDAVLDLAQLTVLFETWQQHLKRKAKRWPDEVDLVDCRVREMGLGEAFDRLEAIGVTLRDVRCIDFDD
ncbi:hypothetical protein FRC01_010378 [Tulasnella sp. 417]|nr:hypothetical protein FRC01_010378 [Tulasnella sp. 417]